LRSVALATLALAIAYYAAVQVGNALAFKTAPVSTLWPPNAVVLSALLLTPKRVWPMLLLGVLPPHLLAQSLADVPLTMSVCWYVSNCAEALFGALLLVRLLGSAPRLDRVRDLAAYTLIAVLAAPVLSSFLDAGCVAWRGWRYTQFWHVWEDRTLSNSLASLIVGPLILTTFRRERNGAPGSLSRSLETLAILAGVVTASLLVFRWTDPRTVAPALLYAPLPFLLWAAVRRGVGGVAPCMAIVSLLSITSVQMGFGPFSHQPAPGAARCLQTFLIIAGTSLSLLAASLAELKDEKRAALTRIEGLNLALTAARMGTWQWDMKLDAVTWSDTDPKTALPRLIRSTSIVRILKQVVPADRALLAQAISTAIDGQGTVEAEFRLRGRNGRVRWLSTRGKTIRTGRGKPALVVGVYGDTTHRKSQDAQSARQREEIARLNRVALLNALSGTLAHELHQPLTAIIANAEAGRIHLARGARDVSELGAVLEDIETDCHRIVRTTQRLSTLLERANAPTEAVDVNECIRRVLERERDYLQAYHVTAGTRLATRLPVLTIGGVQLQQVLTHLILNACDAMALLPARDRRLEIVSTHREDRGVNIVVSDGGMGIKDPEAIFEPFFTTKGRGIGLGLAVCRTIVASHGGRLWATNNTPRGASLHVSLPAAAR
jgi:signal transduction histidine kinase